MDDKKLHILIIPSWYPKYEGDVGGSFFREQAIALKSKGFNIGVIFPQIRSIKNAFSDFNGVKKELDEEIATYRCGFINLTPRLTRIIQKKWLKVGEKLFELYIKENGIPDILHAHSLFNGGLLANALSAKYKIPFVITEHSTAFSRGLLTKKQMNDAQLVVNNASSCIAVSEEFRGLLNQSFNTYKWNYIPNIVNDNFFRVNFNENSENNKKFRFINVCFLEKKKNVDLLIRAFYFLSKKVINIELEIGGDGPQLSHLMNLVNELNLNEKVHFYGKLSRTEVMEKVSKANAFVLSSEYETFGVVLIEALALGKPVIATKCGGPETIVTSDVGYLVEKNSLQALVEGMFLLYSNYNDYIAEDIRGYCRKEFSEETVVTKLYDIYNSVIKNNE